MRFIFYSCPSVFAAGLQCITSDSEYEFTLKMATAMFAETLVNTQHSTRLTPESRSYMFVFYVVLRFCTMHQSSSIDKFGFEIQVIL
jgi:hypothetical protein